MLRIAEKNKFFCIPLRIEFFSAFTYAKSLEHFKCIKLTEALSALCALCVTGQKGHQLGRIDM